MSRKVSAGILLYRFRDGELEMLLAHPGGPYFRNKDIGHWTVPKGEPDDGDELAVAAAREFEEETGFTLASVARDPSAAPIDLGSVTQASGKRVHAWGVEGDLNPDVCTSNSFELEWPPGSGRKETFPEIDRVGWFGVEDARGRLNLSQSAFVDRLIAAVGAVRTAEGSR